MSDLNQYKRGVIHVLLSCVTLWFFANCYKDKGNYEIDIPDRPLVAELDTLYEATVGDSLVIVPKITGLDTSEVDGLWRIDVPEAVSADLYHYEGKALRIVFGLQAKLYTARLTLTNKANGMKYFYNFKIQGRTEFSRGSLVLSVDGGITKLSFIKPDSTVQPNIYEALNNKQLPADPLHIHYLSNQFTGGTPLGYWIISKHAGVRLDVNNLKEDELRPATLRDNFFLAPEQMEVGSLQGYQMGTLLGVINGKFYNGTTSTWDQSTTYGMFGTYADGEYELSPNFVLSYINGAFSIIAFEKIKKQFVRINLYGGAMYFGTQYSVVGAEIFDPTDVKLDLLQLVQINSADTYAYMRDANGAIYELKFNVNFDGPFLFTAGHKRAFVRPEWMSEQTKMLATRNGNIYVAYQNKVYRYTPINQQVQELATAFAQNVTMMKLSDNENTLVVGAGQRIYYLDIQVGKNGVLTGQIDGIPGNPVDMTWRN
ncbi:PKD-like family lipoprotein [Sphingobacterium sp. LRF_L2]|uniref:PKD-like family lipoprotein n=1 Tax=Sphingobacterium sp. LRF_L2 TaxID=3369421 RepID=UPI003F5DBA39